MVWKGDNIRDNMKYLIRFFLIFFISTSLLLAGQAKNLIDLLKRRERWWRLGNVGGFI